MSDRFDFKKYKDSDGNVIRAAKVDDESPSEVETYGYQKLTLTPGMHVVEVRPGMYAPVDGESYTLADDDDEETGSAFEEEVPVTESYDPNEHTVTDVLAELDRRRSEGDRAGYDRLMEAERNGKNRTGVTSQSF